MKQKHWRIGKPITKNKAWEFELSAFGDYWQWFNLNLKWSRAQDHAGIEFEIEVLGLYLGIRLYDCRHWNCLEKRWYHKGEEWDKFELDKEENEQI